MTTKEKSVRTVCDSEHPSGVKILVKKRSQRRAGSKALDNQAGVQVIARAASILKVLQEHPEGLSFSQIAERVVLPRSTVHRIVSALEAERFVSKSSRDGRVRLGSALVLLGKAVTRDWRHEVRPCLEELFLRVNETVDLAILEDDHALFIDQIAAPHRLQAVSGVGISFPLHCTSNGKALLAQLSHDEIEGLIPEQLPALTPNTITTRVRLLEELERVKVEHVAYDREEHTVGICAVGTAIASATGTLAAISIPVPTLRFYGNEEKLAAALLDTCKLIRQRFDLL